MNKRIYCLTENNDFQLAVSAVTDVDIISVVSDFDSFTEVYSPELTSIFIVDVEFFNNLDLSDKSFFDNKDNVLIHDYQHSEINDLLNFLDTIEEDISNSEKLGKLKSIQQV